MKRHTFKDNLISLLIGCVIGVPLALYANTHRTSTTAVYPVHEVQFMELTEEVEEVKKDEMDYSIPEATPDDIEEEIYWDSLELLACCVEAEAGNQPEIGKRLVTDVPLNRVDDPDFPGNLWDVIMQEHQFSVVTNGSIFTVEPTEETYRIVWEEVQERTNEEVLYFCSTGYLPYGTPWQKIGDHYFNTK